MNEEVFIKIAETVVLAEQPNIYKIYNDKVKNNNGAVLLIQNDIHYDTIIVSNEINTEMFDHLSDSQREKIKVSNNKGDKIFVIVAGNTGFFAYYELSNSFFHTLEIKLIDVVKGQERYVSVIAYNLCNDYMLFYFDYDKWVKNNRQPLEDKESVNLIALSINEIIENKQPNETYLTKIYYYTYLSFNKIFRGDDGVATASGVASWTNEIAKENFIIIVDILIEMYQTFFEEAELSETEISDFDLDIIRFGKITKGDGIRFDHNLKNFDHLIGLMNK
jgi:hypothetical protein